MLISRCVAIDHLRSPKRDHNVWKMEAHRVSPEVHLAQRVTVGELDDLPCDVRSRLGADERLVCLVSVGSDQQRYTLIIDASWIELAAEASEIDRHLVDDLSLPRSVVDAVVAGWPEDWCSIREDPGPTSLPPQRSRHERRKTVWWSDDDIPHVGERSSK